MLGHIDSVLFGPNNLVVKYLLEESEVDQQGACLSHPGVRLHSWMKKDVLAVSLKEVRGQLALIGDRWLLTTRYVRQKSNGTRRNRESSIEQQF